MESTHIPTYDKSVQGYRTFYKVDDPGIVAADILDMPGEQGVTLTRWKSDEDYTETWHASFVRAEVLALEWARLLS